MRGPLTPEQQLKVLGKVWGADRDGYVFLPHIDGSARTVERRRRSYYEGRAYEWPRERGAILEHLRKHEGDDLYFTPALFNAKRRTEQNVEAERTLWADLDPVDPRSLGDLRPTIAWQTSPGRYQGVWLLDRPKVGASWASKENHRLSLHVGADPSGWDSTQLLRVPGRPNHKPAYGDGPVEGELLWDSGPRYVWEDFADLPEVGSLAGEDVELLDEDLLGGVDRHALWSTVRLRVSRLCREYMAARSDGGADRSEVLWQVERELADAGCSVLEIVALVRLTVWNKYAGRDDELKRLKVEAAKAVAAKADRPLEEAGADDDAPKPELRWLSALAATAIPRPRWLVEDVWTRGGCGFISGQPKSYKSWLALDLAVSVSTGTPWLGVAPVRRARPVLYLQEEDDLRLVMSRLSSVLESKAPALHWQGRLRAPQSSAEPGRGVDKEPGPLRPQKLLWEPPEGDVPLAVHVQGGFVASDPAWQAWLTEKVEEGRFGLVVVDTLGTTAGDVDTDRSTELMGRILRPLKAVAQAHEAAICVVHHNRKSPSDGKGGRAGQEMLGSVALHAWVDCAVYARSREGGELHLEREAKQAPELSMRVRVPRMHESHRTGERQLWEPELVPVASEETQHRPTPAAEARREREQPRARTGALVAKLRNMGLKPGVPVRAERIDGPLSAAEVRRLVESGDLEHRPESSTYVWRKR